MCVWGGGGGGVTVGIPPPPCPEMCWNLDVIWCTLATFTPINSAHGFPGVFLFVCCCRWVVVCCWVVVVFLSFWLFVVCLFVFFFGGGKICGRHCVQFAYRQVRV